MTKFSFVCVFIVAACFNVVLTAEDLVEEDYKEQNIRPVGRSYSLTTCDYQSQIGYSCLSCSRALHCYIGNVAILVDCYGFFRHCRDGRCSARQDEKCAAKATTTGPTISPIDTANVATSSEATTKLLTETIAETVALTATESVAATATESVAATATESVAATVTETVQATATESVAATVTEPVIVAVDEKSTTKIDTATVTETETATTKSDVSTTVAVDISSNVV